MNVTKYKIFLLSVFVFETITAQQLPRYSEYMFDKAIVNPAYAGSIPFISVTTAHRQQFMGIEGAPVTQFLSFHAPIQKKNIGLGVKVINDNLATIRNISAEGLFSYHLGLGNGRFSAGIEAGLFNQSIDFSGLIRHDPIDNAITNDKETKSVFDASFGMFYQTKTFFIGWTSFQLVSSKINYTGHERGMASRLWNHNYWIAGFNFGSEKFRMEPSVLLKQIKPVSLQMDINLRATFKQFITIGTTYRLKESLVGMIEVLIKENWKLGYAYDYTISDLATYQNGSHEIMLTYRKKLLPPAREKETHPRFYIY